MTCNKPFEAVSPVVPLCEANDLEAGSNSWPERLALPEQARGSAFYDVREAPRQAQLRQARNVWLGTARRPLPRWICTARTRAPPSCRPKRGRARAEWEGAGSARISRSGCQELQRQAQQELGPQPQVCVCVETVFLLKAAAASLAAAANARVGASG